MRARPRLLAGSEPDSKTRTMLREQPASSASRCCDMPSAALRPRIVADSLDSVGAITTSEHHKSSLAKNASWKERRKPANRLAPPCTKAVAAHVAQDGRGCWLMAPDEAFRLAVAPGQAPELEDDVGSCVSAPAVGKKTTLCAQGRRRCPHPMVRETIRSSSDDRSASWRTVPNARTPKVHGVGVLAAACGTE